MPTAAVSEASGNPIKKVTVNLYQSDLTALRELAQLRGSNVTEALRRAIATERFFSEAARRGDKILLEDASGGSRREIVFLDTSLSRTAEQAE
jgi:hypothetical protein